jgi:endo-1,4-beta-xylanase
MGDEKFLGNNWRNGGNADDFYTHYWNQVSLSNSGKWGVAERSRDNFNWFLVDRAYDFTRQHSIPLKWHTVIWAEQQPSWIESLSGEEQLAEVEEWIEAFAQRYPLVEMVDVVNESLGTRPSYYEALGGNGETGWDWVIWSFSKVREYLPNAELHINGTKILRNDEKTTRFLNLIHLLQEQNLVDGIGVQAHFLEVEDDQTVLRNLDRLAETGLPIYITELDLTFSDDEAQLNRMKELFPIFWEHPSVKGVTFWGYKEGFIWKENAYLLRSTQEPRPAFVWLKTYLTQGDPFHSTVIHDDGWFYSPWLGLANAAYSPWIYTLDAGWVFIKPDQADSLFLYHPNDSWLWCAIDTWPFGWSYGANSWINILDE